MSKIIMLIVLSMATQNEHVFLFIIFLNEHNKIVSCINSCSFSRYLEGFPQYNYLDETTLLRD